VQDTDHRESDQDGCHGVYLDPYQGLKLVTSKVKSGQDPVDP